MEKCQYIDIYFRRVPYVYCAIMLCMRLRLVMSLVGRFIAYYVPAPVSALSALSVSAARRQFHFPSYRAQSEHGAHSENSEHSEHSEL